MKSIIYRVSATGIALTIAGALVLYSDADVATPKTLPLWVIESYGDELADRVFDPTAQAPRSWFDGLTLQMLSSMSTDQLSDWGQEMQSNVVYEPRSFALHNSEERLLEAVVDLCIAEPQKPDPEIAERLSFLEVQTLRWSRQFARHVADPLLRRLRGVGVSHHSGHAGDFVCRLVVQSDIRPTWPSAISPSEIVSGTEPHKLLAALSDANPKTRAAAVAEIATYDGTGAAMLMMAALRDGHPGVRLMAVNALESRAKERWGVPPS